MSKISNVTLMLEYLSSGRKYSIQELSELLEVSPRMVRIYKEELEKAGIFVETLKGVYGGYVLNQHINTPYLLFDHQDVAAIDECILQSDDGNLKNRLVDIKKKITTNLLKDENSKDTLMNNDQELNVYNKLSRALKNHKKVRIKYYNLQHGESIRTIYPLGMYLFQGEWWCSSYWEEKDDMRQFHITRISECDILDETFEPQKINIKF